MMQQYETQPASPIRRDGSLLALSVSALAVFALLSGLGLWQLQRLEWKEGIIARIESRMQAPAVPMPPESQWALVKGTDYEYRRVQVSGVFDHAREALVFRPSSAGQRGPGYHVLTPLALADGSHVIVNRGYVSENRRDPATRAAGQAAGEITVTGFLRPPESRNSFTPADSPATGIWYTRDPHAIASHFNIKRAAPFVVDADAAPNPGGWPRGGATIVQIRNDHLSYALTWFGLALTLVGVYGAFVWRHFRTRRR